MDLRDWLIQADQIDRRRFSAARYRAIDRHGAAFPLGRIPEEVDRGALTLTRAIILGRAGWHSFHRPQRGHRADHWTTPALMAVNNQIARLGRGNF